MSEFKYGDMVEVRDSENQTWSEPRFYLGNVPIPNGGIRHYTMSYGENESNFNGNLFCWKHVRKVKPKPALTIEERLEQIEIMLRNLQNP